MTKFHAEECPFGTFFRILEVVNVKHLIRLSDFGEKGIYEVFRLADDLPALYPRGRGIGGCDRQRLFCRLLL